MARSEHLKDFIRAEMQGVRADLGTVQAEPGAVMGSDGWRGAGEKSETASSGINCSRSKPIWLPWCPSPWP